MTGTGTQGTPCIGNCRANKRKESQTCETLQRETTARGAMTQSQLAACRTRCGRAGGSGHENGASQASQLTGSPSQTCSPKAHRAPPWAHEGPEPNLTLCHHCVEVFNKGPTFSFCTTPHKFCSWSCTQHWAQQLSEVVMFEYPITKSKQHLDSLQGIKPGLLLFLKVPIRRQR